MSGQGLVGELNTGDVNLNPISGAQGGTASGGTFGDFVIGGKDTMPVSFGQIGILAGLGIFGVALWILLSKN